MANESRRRGWGTAPGGDGDDGVVYDMAATGVRSQPGASAPADVGRAADRRRPYVPESVDDNVTFDEYLAYRSPVAGLGDFVCGAVNATGRVVVHGDGRRRTSGPTVRSCTVDR